MRAKVKNQTASGPIGIAARAAETAAREAELAALPTTAAGWASKSTELRAELAEVEDELAALPAQRRALALDAHAGSVEAQERLAGLNARQGELAGLVDRLTLALEAAAEAEGEAQAAERIEAEAKRRMAAADAARVVLAHAQQLDEVAKALAERQAAYMEAVSTMSRLAPEQWSILSRRSELHMTGALAEAGVLRPAGLGHPQRDLVQPLGQAAGATLAALIGEAPITTPATAQEIAA